MRDFYIIRASNKDLLTGNIYLSPSHPSNFFHFREFFCLTNSRHIFSPPSLFVYWNSVFFDFYCFSTGGGALGGLCVYSHISQSTLNWQHVPFYILRHRRRSETERLRVFWLCGDSFFFLWEFWVALPHCWDLGGWGVFFFSVICGWSQALIQFHSNVVFSNRFHFNGQFQEAAIAKINWASHSRLHPGWKHLSNGVFYWQYGRTASQAAVPLPLELHKT